MEQYIKTILSSPLLFLIVIAGAIIWQQMNSKRLAKEAGQQERQAIFFSWIMAVSIFLCVANGWMSVAIGGAIIEASVNIFLVLKIRQHHQMKAAKITDQIESYTDKQRKGMEVRTLIEARELHHEELTNLSLVINIFIGILMPMFIVFMSELYIKSGI